MADNGEGECSIRAGSSLVVGSGARMGGGGAERWRGGEGSSLRICFKDIVGMREEGGGVDGDRGRRERWEQGLLGGGGETPGELAGGIRILAAVFVAT